MLQKEILSSNDCALLVAREPPPCFITWYQIIGSRNRERAVYIFLFER